MAAAELVELGSGSSRKTRLLLEAMHRHGGGRRYAPLDVSADALEGAAAALTASYPWLEFEGFVGDFTADLPWVPRRGRRLLAFLGSTIGNLDPAERADLLGAVAAALRPEDRFLLGVDLVKDPAVLQAAYDDAAGALRTEISSKFTREGVERELAAAGLRLGSWHTDGEHRFACAAAAR